MGELELERKGGSSLDGAQQEGRKRSNALLSNIRSHILIQIIDVHELLERSGSFEAAERSVIASGEPSRTCQLDGCLGKRTLT